MEMYNTSAIKSACEKERERKSNIFYCLSSSQGQAANWLLKDVKAAARSLAQMQIKSSKVREMQLE
jgi:hypothetical protein